MKMSDRNNSYYIVVLMILSTIAFFTNFAHAMEIEYDKNGKIEEAEGKILEDKFEPGEGRLSLKDAVEALKKAGKTPTGKWEFDKSFLNGWYYEFEGFDNNQKMEYTIDAKTGKLQKEKIDD